MIMQANKQFTSRLGDIVAGRQDILIEPNPRLHAMPSGMAGGPSVLQGFFSGIRTPAKRLAELEYYDYLETEIPDVRKALDTFTTMAVTGNLAGGGTSTYEVKPDGDQEYPDELMERLASSQRLILNNAGICIRNMAKYGSYMPELIVERKANGRKTIGKLKPIPPGTIYRNISRDGRSDPQKYWVQVIDGKVVGAQDQYQSGEMSSVGIPQWLLPHFAMWTNVVSATNTLLYGTSLLQPFGAIGLKVHASIDSMVVARLSRAAMRYAWKIDVSDIKNDQEAIRRRVKSWQQQVARSTSLLNSATNVDSYQRASVPDSDFFIPSADGLSWGLDTIAGDANLPNVRDVELLVRFYFGALGVPPEYLGHERSQGGRSSLTQIDIHFARTVRHIQLFAVPAFEHIVYADMILGGWDPREWPIKVTPPQIGARDDLLQAQIRALQSAVIANLVAAGMDPTIDPAWVFKIFMHFDNELNELEKKQIEKLFGTRLSEAKKSSSVPTPDQQRRIYEVMQQNVGDLMAVVRENIRLLLLNNDPTAGHIYDTNQPTPGEIFAAINSE